MRGVECLECGRGSANIITRFNCIHSQFTEDVEDVVIEDEWANTWDGRQFLNFQDNDWNILLFATDDNFVKLSQCDTVFIDGTFKTCPAPYEQFVSLHGIYIDRALPFVLCLMGGRTVGHYRRLLAHVKQEVRRITGRNWRPRLVISDFENAILIALQTELRRTQVRGCYFHFTQSLWRRIQSIGLAPAYNNSRRLRACLRKFMAIGYLPVAVVRNNFHLHANDIDTQRLCHRYPQLREFIEYLDRNYVRAVAQFPTAMWNVYDRDIDTRTNNHVEGNNNIVRNNKYNLNKIYFKSDNNSIEYNDNNNNKNNINNNK